MDTFDYYTLVLAIFILAVAIILLARRVRRVENTLDQIRMATYELTSIARDDIDDMRDALKAANIDIPRTRAKERMRRNMLSSEERERESIEKFNQAVAEAERLWGE